LRDRIGTPFFFIPWGVGSTQAGAEAPPRPVSARSLVGQVVEGRFLVREKTGHSPQSVQFDAHDIMGDLGVVLEIYPDGTAAAGYRLGCADTPSVPHRDLPNLFTAAADVPRSPLPARTTPTRPSLWTRIWSALTGR